MAGTAFASPVTGVSGHDFDSDGDQRFIAAIRGKPVLKTGVDDALLPMLPRVCLKPAAKRCCGELIEQTIVTGRRACPRDQEVHVAIRRASVDDA